MRDLLRLFLLLVCSVGIGLPAYNPMTTFLSHYTKVCPSDDGIAQEIGCKDPLEKGEDLEVKGVSIPTRSRRLGIHIGMGVDVDYVANRKMYDPDWKQNIYRFSTQSVLGRLSVTLEQQEFFVTIGSMRWKEQGAMPTFMYYPYIPLEFALHQSCSNTDMCWSVGFITSWALSNRWFIGCSGEYKEASVYLSSQQFILPKTPVSAYYGPFITYYDFTKTTYQEWQAASGLSIWLYMAENSVAGISVYSNAKLAYARLRTHYTEKEDASLFHHHLHTRHRIGLAHGVSIVMNEKFSLTIEGRWLDEEGVLTNAQFYF